MGIIDLYKKLLTLAQESPAWLLFIKEILSQVKDVSFNGLFLANGLPAEYEFDPMDSYLASDTFVYGIDLQSSFNAVNMLKVFGIDAAVSSEGELLFDSSVGSLSKMYHYYVVSGIDYDDNTKIFVDNGKILTLVNNKFDYFPAKEVSDSFVVVSENVDEEYVSGIVPYNKILYSYNGKKYLTDKIIMHVDASVTAINYKSIYKDISEIYNGATLNNVNEKNTVISLFDKLNRFAYDNGIDKSRLYYKYVYLDGVNEVSGDDSFVLDNVLKLTPVSVKKNGNEYILNYYCDTDCNINPKTDFIVNGTNNLKVLGYDKHFMVLSLELTDAHTYLASNTDENGVVGAYMIESNDGRKVIKSEKIDFGTSILRTNSLYQKSSFKMKSKINIYVENKYLDDVKNIVDNCVPMRCVVNYVESNSKLVNDKVVISDY